MCMCLVRHGVHNRSKRLATVKRTPTLRSGQPIWLEDSRRRSTRFASLKGPEACDVVIVGGGMTGALTARMFSAAGVSVCLLEAGTVGRGSTAASSALLLQEPDYGMQELARRYGAATSVRIWQVS